MSLLGVLGAALAVSQPAVGTDYAVYHGKARADIGAVTAAAARADVLVVGETHDDAVGHRVELELLKGLHARTPKVQLSLEMFERDVQPVVDEYVGGLISRKAFLDASRPWPNYATDYAPMVEYARENKLPVIAANAPRRYASRVSRMGRAALLDLPAASRAFLPPLPYDMDLPAGYGAFLDQIFAGNHGTANASMPTPEHLKEAQALWDAAMADSVAGAFKRRGGVVMHVNGGGHSDHGWGLVARLRKLAPKARVVTVSIRPAEDPTAGPGDDADLADYVVLTRKAAAAN